MKTLWQAVRKLLNRLWGALVFLKDAATFNHEEQRTFYWLLWLLAFTGIIQLVAHQGQHATTMEQIRAYALKRPQSRIETEFYGELAAQRIKHGLKPQADSPTLELAAQVRLKDMQSRHYWGHFGPGNQGKAYLQAYRVYGGSCGECCCWGYETPVEALDAFLRSPGHRAMMLGKHTKIGCAAGDVEIDGVIQKTYVVLFGDR